MNAMRALLQAPSVYAADLLVLPEEDHMSVGFGSEYALERMKQYLVEHLQFNTTTR